MKKIASSLLILLLTATSISAQTYSTVSTSAGTSSPGLLNGPVTSAEFFHPYAICYDPVTNTFYIADTGNNCIRKIKNGVVSTLAGSTVSGDADGADTSARFYSPGGICYYNGNIYVTDNGNNKIKRIDTLGNVVTIAGTGTPGHQDGSLLQAQFFNPFDIQVDNSGNFYIADYGNHCIRKISGGTVSTVAGTPGVSGDQVGLASAAKFNRPRSICFDASGNLYIADMLNHKIKMLSTTGNVSLVAGSGSAGNQDGTGTGASFNQPLGVTMDLYGNILVSDGGNFIIRRVTPAGVVVTAAGTGSSGLTNGAVLTAATFNTPVGICLANGELYIADVYNNVIRKLDMSDVGMGENTEKSPLALFPNPAGDQVSITNTQKWKTIRIYDMQGKCCKTIDVNGEPDTVVISVSDLASGQYLIIAENDRQKADGKLIRE